MKRRRRTQDATGIKEVLSTEYSTWYWDQLGSRIMRRDRTTISRIVSDPYAQAVDIMAIDNNFKGATKRACRREYDRLLAEEHESEERMHEKT